MNSFYRGKRVLVPGGAGFIGAHLVKKLLGQGAFVCVLDNFISGSQRNLIAVKDHANFSIIEQDICEPVHQEAEIIFSLACPASPVQYQRNPIETLRSSVFGVYNLLTLAEKTGARLVHASTSEVYGDPLQHPQTETYWGNVNPVGIRACYDEGKRAAETLAMDFHRIHDVDLRIARIFNTYGPRMAHDDGRVVSNFVVQALADQDLTVYGDGSATRSFCYVDDMVEALLLLGQSDAARGEIINLGNPQEFTILQLAQMVLGQITCKSKLVYRDLPQDDPVRRQPDIAKAIELLDWHPKIPLAQGLAKTIRYFEQNSGD